jgi:predicted DNA-binding transcriptional regulator AlpA
VRLYISRGNLILSFLEWCELAGLPESTAREMRARGQGPRCVQLGGRKLGVSLAEHRRWVKARTEASA